MSLIETCFMMFRRTPNTALCVKRVSCVHIYLDCVRLLGVLEMDDTEEQGVFGTFQEHEGGALQPQLMQ